VRLSVYGAELEGFTVYAPPGGMGVRARGGVLRRCIILGHGVGDVGYFEDDEGWAHHCLISGFHFGNWLAGYFQANASNSILYGNDFDSVGPAYYSVFGSIYLGLGGGPHSITASPQCFDFVGHDFHLRPASPCIDAGDPNSPLDPDGTRADIGPIPFDPNYEPYTTYCTAKVNSLGCTPTIAAQNTASVTSGRPFWITCSNQINHRSGLMSYGLSPLATPYQGGYLCVGSPKRRTSALDSGGSSNGADCSGMFVVEFNATIQSGLEPTLTLGAEVYCQFWSRDPGSSFSSNRSDALKFRIAP